jgi:hypothetical protein
LSLSPNQLRIAKLPKAIRGGQGAVNLLVNVFGTMLDNPDTTVDEVMDAGYEGGAETVRSWWG